MNYDLKPHSTKVLQDIINSLGGYVQSEFAHQEQVNQGKSVTVKGSDVRVPYRCGIIVAPSGSSAEGDGSYMGNQPGALPGFMFRGVWIPLSFIAGQGAPKAHL